MRVLMGGLREKWRPHYAQKRFSVRLFALEQFISSPRGRTAIKQAGDVSKGELKDLEEAEERSLEHAKEDDPAVSRPSHANAADGKHRPK